ncbi:NADP-dependent phosphogluconate dehydrogenase [Phycicoccus sp. CSK15P-2]|uniref:NADP-dependent phosphogluconate dehydrogenase n=1 Tax=Phycicoccus sp. CSK15P-2 TaxID=2807627 RepID=UPI00194DD1AF|nr:NADP-dependent phosphogluconate dehydrogenase [Phycicoccus sp. CSK15P-2]MBM6405313.1 NADP-dependent phosphogluconate dehydrogenase [Phycicoccus sp. CSK15P-2]
MPDTASTTSGTAQIGVTGLAVMGRNLARNFARHGFRVAVHNRATSKAEALVEEFGDEGDFTLARSLEDLVAALERPRRIVVMVKAGEGTDAVVDELVPLLDEGDIVADAGNAHFADTRRRHAALAQKGIRFAGVGVSGGEVGALEGPSIMPGCDGDTYAELGPFLEVVSAHVDDEPCCTLVGPDGAGHFVKMVHNGIEYSDMQLIAETYDLLRGVLGQEPAEAAETFRAWNGTELESYLVEIAAEVLSHTDGDTGRPFVDVVRDAAEQKGTGRWTVQTALDLGVPVTGIAEATMARAVSGDTQRRAAVREALDVAEEPPGADLAVEDLRAALYAAKVVSYAQGLDMVREGSTEHHWDVDPADLARIWRDGCIIRARLLGDITEAVEDHPDAPSLLATPTFAAAVADRLPGLRRVVGAAVASGVPVPVFSSVLAYVDALRAERLPAALVQGLRDYFGAHTYGRVDREGTFHTLWSQDRSEVETG